MSEMFTEEFYQTLPHLPRNGVRGSQGKFITASLFLETCNPGVEKEVRWCLSEVEKTSNITEQTYPSAWMVFIHAKNEYDAMRKIVGNVEQWELLKQLKWFRAHYERWNNELKMMEKSLMRQSLTAIVKGGESGAVAASRLLLKEFGEDVPMGEKKKVGRPVNVDVYSPDHEGVVDKDLSRVLEFGKKKHS